MEDETIIGKWDYQVTGSSEPMIIIKLHLKLLGKDNWSEEIELLVDTGFDGEILLTDELYTLAGYINISFPEDQWSKAQSITGDIIKLRKCNTLALIDKIEFDVIIESHSSIQENVIGRGFLNRFTSLLEGKKLQWT